MNKLMTTIVHAQLRDYARW